MGAQQTGAGGRRRRRGRQRRAPCVPCGAAAAHRPHLLCAGGRWHLVRLPLLARGASDASIQRDGQLGGQRGQHALHVHAVVLLQKVLRHRCRTVRYRYMTRQCRCRARSSPGQSWSLHRAAEQEGRAGGWAAASLGGQAGGGHAARRRRTSQACWLSTGRPPLMASPPAQEREGPGRTQAAARAWWQLVPAQPPAPALLQIPAPRAAGHTASRIHAAGRQAHAAGAAGRRRACAEEVHHQLPVARGLHHALQQRACVAVEALGAGGRGGGGWEREVGEVCAGCCAGNAAPRFHARHAACARLSQSRLHPVERERCASPPPARQPTPPGAALPAHAPARSAGWAPAPAAPCPPGATPAGSRGAAGCRWAAG